MAEAKITNRRRTARTARSRATIKASESRPVLHVYRSNKHIYAQIIDHTGKVLATASDVKLKDKKTPTEVATHVGSEIGKMAVTNKVKEVAFNRRSYKYHGRVKALADAAREAGLVF